MPLALGFLMNRDYKFHRIFFYMILGCGKIFPAGMWKNTAN